MKKIFSSTIAFLNGRIIPSSIYFGISCAIWGNLSQGYIASGAEIAKGTEKNFKERSKLCSKCQTKKTDLKLKERIFSCACGLNICRDLNSSINLKQAPVDEIVNRVGSIRINACEHDTADGHGLKQEVNTIAKQLV